MTIVRDGKEIELTDQELANAYFEQQFLFDCDDVRDLFDQYVDEDDLIEEYGKTRDELEAYVEDIAVEMRRQMDKYGCDWEYARSEAVHDILCNTK